MNIIYQTMIIPATCVATHEESGWLMASFYDQEYDQLEDVFLHEKLDHDHMKRGLIETAHKLGMKGTLFITHVWVPGTSLGGMAGTRCPLGPAVEAFQEL